MPTRSVELTHELDCFVTGKIESGQYSSANEVMNAALRSLERDEREYELKLSALRDAIDEGDASGLAGKGAFERVRQSLGLTR